MGEIYEACKYATEIDSTQNDWFRHSNLKGGDMHIHTQTEQVILKAELPPPFFFRNKKISLKEWPIADR
jgi:hypothetical protein